MSTFEKSTNDKAYFKIIDGELRRSVPMGTEGAEKREYKGKIYNEVPYPAIIGKIVDISFEDGEYEGKKFNSLKITFDENEEIGKKPVISIGSGTKYAMDIMHRLPNVDLEEEVRLRPYSFLPEGEEKEVTGVEIMQRDNATGNFTKKINSFFFKKDGEKNIAINDFPLRDAPYDEQSEEEREIYKIKRKGFLIKHTKEMVIPKLAERTIGVSSKSYEEQMERQGSYPKEEINPEEIPF